MAEQWHRKFTEEHLAHIHIRMHVMMTSTHRRGSQCNNRHRRRDNTTQPRTTCAKCVATTTCSPPKQARKGALVKSHTYLDEVGGDVCLSVVRQACACVQAPQHKPLLVFVCTNPENALRVQPTYRRQHQVASQLHDDTGHVVSCVGRGRTTNRQSKIKKTHTPQQTSARHNDTTTHAPRRKHERRTAQATYPKETVTRAHPHRC